MRSPFMFNISGDFLCYTLYTSFRALRSALYTLALRFISNSTIIKISSRCTLPISFIQKTKDEPRNLEGTPNDKKCFLLIFQSLFLLLYLAPKHRPITERQPREERQIICTNFHSNLWIIQKKVVSLRSINLKY